MLKRKIYNQILDWKNKKTHYPLIIEGLRQVGKTYIVKEFAYNNFAHVIYIDFRKDREVKKMFEGDFDIDKIMINLSSYYQEEYEPYKTILIFDEVQDCLNARSSLKYFYLDGRYEVIATGSLLGVKGYNLKKTERGIPVGYEETIRMYSLDFEEFILNSNSFNEMEIAIIKKSFEDKTQIPQLLHNKLNIFFKYYICVGGLPSSVDSFFKTKNISISYEINKNLIEDYKSDFGKHLNESGEIEINEKEKIILNEVFDSLPSQLAKENKKFSFSKVGGKYRNDQYLNALKYLEEYGLIKRVYNLKKVEDPLNGFKDETSFKVYFTDIGILTALHDFSILTNIINNNLYIYKGSIYENVILDILFKNNNDIFYYKKNSGLEIDFIMKYENEILPIEVKAVNGNSKSLKTFLNDVNNNNIHFALRFSEKNYSKLELNDKTIYYLPHYLSFLFKNIRKDIIVDF